MRIVFGVFAVLILCSCGQSTSSTSDLMKRDNDQYPMTPNLEMTPGKLCEDPDYLRHPERIPYCERSVSSSRKWSIIRKYDSEFGYHIEDTGRSAFKVDHLIPLCFGGSNSNENLWPQHRTVYEKTDNLEHKLCQLLSNGDVTQQKAVALILKAKRDLSKVPEVSDEIDAMMEEAN